MKSFEESDYVVTFTGEAPSSRLVRGWDRVLAYLDFQATNGSEEESYRRPDDPIHERDNWTTLGGTHIDDGGDDRHEYSADIGEICHVTVTRLTEPLNEAWLDDAAWHKQEAGGG